MFLQDLHDPAPATPPPSAPKGLMAACMAFLDRCAYRAMTTDEDLEHLLRWRWENYRAGGSIRDIESPAEFDDHKDQLPTARTVGVYYDGRLVASMRTHAINSDVPENLRVVDILRDEVAREVEKGARFVYASRWTSDPRLKTSMPLVVATTRITCLAAGYHNADALLNTSRENHLKMYRRMQDAEPWIEEPTLVENFDFRYFLVRSPYRVFRARMFTDRQPYLSSDRERRAMFAPDADPGAMIAPSAAAVLEGREAAAD